MKSLEITNDLSNFKFLEETDGIRGKKYYLVGKVQQCIPNKNRRIYPAEMWDALHEDPEFKARLSSGRLVGSIGHPGKDQVFDPEKTALTVREHWRDGDDVFAKLEILADLPSGKILLAMYKSGVYLGVSSRGGGPSVEQDGYEVLSVGFMLDGYDAVVDPSVATAMPVPQFESSKKKFASFMESVIKDASKEDIAYYNTFTKSVFGESVQSSTKPSNHKNNMSDKLYQEAVRKSAVLEQQVTKFKSDATSSAEKFKTLESRHNALKTVAEKLESASTSKDSRIKALESALATANKRLEAAKELLSASMKKTESVASSYSTTSAKLEAAKKLLLAFESSKSVSAKKSLESYITEKVSKFSESQKSSVKSILSKCESIDAVNETLKSLQPLISSKSNPTLPKVESVKGTKTTKTESHQPSVKLNPLIQAMKDSGKLVG